MRRSLAVLALAAVAGLLALLPVAASAQTLEDWVITDYTVTMEVTPASDLLVVENIRLDFGTLQRHGIYRDIPLWEDLPDPLPPDSAIDLPEGANPSDWHRVYELDHLEVESSTGAPADVDLTGPSGDTNGNLRIRIGDPDVTVGGQQQYTIRYRIRGALNPFPDHDELYWDAIGTGWGVPIQRASATVQGPGIQGDTACFQGRQFSTAECQSSVTDGRASFASTGPLQPFEGMTIGVRFGPGTIDVPAPIVDRKPSIALALAGRPAAIPLTVATGVLGLAGILLLVWREGRDRVARGGVTASGQVDPLRAVGRRKGLFEPRPVPVQYRPPDDLKPAELGLVIDERVDDVDISATIVDLAVRGHLRIEETQEAGWFRKADWKIVKGTDPQDAANDYEQILLDGLFDGRDSVEVSDLKGTFHTDYAKAQKAIYADGQRRRWFARRPDRARSLWTGVGFGIAALGVGLIVLLVRFDTRVTLAGIPIVLVGLLLAALNGRMPRRTPKGSNLLVQTLGFREFITRAETGRMAFAEAENLFVSYLPYAVVFGAVDKWAGAFENLGIDPGQAVSGFYAYHGTFSLRHFSAGVNEFSSAVGPAMAQAPASSGGGSFGGGGFSGGGGGGGGGGSW